MSFFMSLGAPFVLLFRTAAAVRAERPSFLACLRQAYELGNRSVWLVAPGLAFFAAVMVTIANVQARRYLGNLSILGPSYFALLVSEFAPILVGLLAAARMGAGTSAELSHMAVSEQVEALKMCAADPLVELVAPRVVGGLFALPLLLVVGTLVASLSAALTALFAFGADGAAFLDPRFLTGRGVLSAIAKSFAFGLYIPLVASWRGLSARGGASQVGVAATTGVVGACFGCLALDFLVDQFFPLA